MAYGASASYLALLPKTVVEDALGFALFSDVPAPTSRRFSPNLLSRATRLTMDMYSRHQVKYHRRVRELRAIGAHAVRNFITSEYNEDHVWWVRFMCDFCGRMADPFELPAAIVSHDLRNAYFLCSKHPLQDVNDELKRFHVGDYERRHLPVWYNPELDYHCTRRMECAHVTFFKERSFELFMRRCSIFYNDGLSKLL
jgi:hypothetical protein